jgi:Tol biopolymer transport system component
MTVFSAATEEDINRRENLYSMDSRGEVRPLTQFPAGIDASLPAISPDGRRIAFTRTSNQTGQEVWLMDADGSNQEPLVPGGMFARAPSWSPDSRWLAVESAAPGKEMIQNDIVLVNVETREVQPLVASSGWEGGPTWSPDGTRIAYHARVAGTNCMQLFVVSRQGGTPEQLTDLRGADCQAQREGDFWPDWSPDTKQPRIAFGRKLDDKEQIALIDLETKHVQVLNTGDTPVGHPRWSPDGRFILFEQEEANGMSLARIDLASGKTTPLDTTIPNSHLADWH